MYFRDLNLSEMLRNAVLKSPLNQDIAEDNIDLVKVEQALDDIEGVVNEAQGLGCSISPKSVGNGLRNLVEALRLDGIHEYTSTGHLKRSTPVVELDPALSDSIKATMGLVVDRRNWETPEQMAGLLREVPDELKRVQFSGGDQTVAQMIMQEQQALYADMRRESSTAAHSSKRATYTQPKEMLKIFDEITRAANDPPEATVSNIKDFAHGKQGGVSPFVS